MHTILFDSYRKYQKENKGKFFKVISKMPIGAKFLLGGLVLSFIYSILAIFFSFFKNTYLISLISQVILCIFSYQSLLTPTDQPLSEVLCPII